MVEAEIAGIKNEYACQLKTQEELLFETSMKDTGRFEVKLPWKIDPINLRNNRILLLERKLSRTPNVLKLGAIDKRFWAFLTDFGR